MDLTRCLKLAGVGMLVLVMGLAPLGCQPSGGPSGGGSQPSVGAGGGSPAAPETGGDESPAKPAADTGAAAAAAGELVTVPLGLPPLPVPDDNPMTAEKIELGKLLYFDTRLSKDGTVSCATCHDPKMAWAEHEPTSKGIKGQVGGANAPTVINTAYLTSMFWDGRMKTLEEQALGPIANPIEMGMELGAMIQNLDKLTGYKDRFQKVFGTGITEENVAKAIAAFERTVLSGNSPYDRSEKGDANALNEEQKRGMDVFMNKATCSMCHATSIFTNGNFVNAGIGMDKAKPDEGRKAVTKKDGDLGKYRVAPLREVAKTAPYFHDGSVATLAEAVNVMAGGGKDNPNLSPMMKGVRDANLTDQDKKDLVAFLGALSGDFPVVEPPEPLAGP